MGYIGVVDDDWLNPMGNDSEAVPFKDLVEAIEWAVDWLHDGLNGKRIVLYAVSDPVYRVTYNPDPQFSEERAEGNEWVLVK